MRRVAWVVAAVLGMAASAAAQPLIYTRSIYNAASYMPAGIPAGAIAQGSIFSIFGADLGPAKGISAEAFPLQTSLAGVSLNVIQGSITVAAIPVYVSATQINAIMPSNAPLGVASLQVINGPKSNLAPVRIAANAFGIFTALGAGSGPGILQNFITATDQPINAPGIPAQPRQYITLWGTGLGPVDSDTVAPSVGSLPVKTEVFVGGVSAPVLYSGRTPCCAGTDQIVFTVPPNAPTGCWVPVYVRTGGVTVSNVVTMAIEPAGTTTCSTDIFPQISAALVKGTTAGAAGVARVLTHEDVGTFATVDVTADYAAYFGAKAASSLFPFHPVLSFPPSGTCTAFTLKGDMLGGDPLPGLLPGLSFLNFGDAATLTGPHGTRSISFNLASPWSTSLLGGAISNNILASSLFLDPGSYQVQTTGGAAGNAVAGFSASFTVPPPLSWTNRDQITAVDRTQPLTISWTGGAAGQIVAVLGFSDDLPSDSSAAFACIAPSGATSFTVPVDILSNLPPSHANPLKSKQAIYLVSIPAESVQTINASGIGQGSTGAIFVDGKTVAFQ